ncbi:Uncharacterised protein [Bacteroides xylanisolvens]|nr:Uncharacterised protein [Bacteroides xylanisolvens]
MEIGQGSIRLPPLFFKPNIKACRFFRFQIRIAIQSYMTTPHEPPEIVVQLWYIRRTEPLPVIGFHAECICGLICNPQLRRRVASVHAMMVITHRRNDIPFPGLYFILHVKSIGVDILLAPFLRHTIASCDRSFFRCISNIGTLYCISDKLAAKGQSVVFRNMHRIPGFDS